MPAKLKLLPLLLLAALTACSNPDETSTTKPDDPTAATLHPASRPLFAAASAPAPETRPVAASQPTTTQPTTATASTLPSAIPANGNPPQALTGGVIVSDLAVGTGTAAKSGDPVTVNYTGFLENGTIFDSSLNPGRTPFQFTIDHGEVIKGWDVGVAGMKVGGKRKLLIPPSMGYGASGQGSIPPNSTLIFEVELLKIGS